VGRDRIIVFTRQPEPGATKTRLIPALGPDGAARLHRALTEHTLAQASCYRKAEIEIQWTGGDEKSMRAWLPEPNRLRKQSDGDLGARMAQALRAAFADGVDRAVVVGCDSPDLGPETYDAAFNALSGHDVVIGPATDGGYYLIGARTSAARAIAPLFSDMPWGTDQVFEATLARLDRSDLTHMQIAVLDDIDRPEDLPAWERHHDKLVRTPWLSVIIPALNEADRLKSTLESIAPGADTEIIVVDGGSSDDTRIVAAAHGARVFDAPRGRASQMNFGAAKAGGDVLLFLHADTRLPPNYKQALRECLASPGVVAGAFRFATDMDSVAMRVVTASVVIRSKVFQMPYGDQGLFLSKESFRRAGAYPPMPIMEDFEFVRRLKRFGNIRIAHAPAITSDNRWRRLGVGKTTLRNASIVALYLLGVQPERLRAIYRRGAN